MGKVRRLTVEIPYSAGAPCDQLARNIGEGCGVAAGHEPGGVGLMSMADPGTTTHRESLLSKAAAIAFTRIFLGVMWLFEVTVGHNWKIGGFGSDVHPGWLGANRGDVVREDVAQAIADGTWSWFASLYESVVVPNAVLFSWLTIIFQVTLGIAFIVGFAVRPLALMALVLDFSIFMLGNSRIPPFFTAMHLFVLGTGAGRFYGLDGYLLGRLADARRGLRGCSFGSSGSRCSGLGSVGSGSRPRPSCRCTSSSPSRCARRCGSRW
jgi:uncharacterized membrane protein YphA (DoxX/SURF4 family)